MKFVRDKLLEHIGAIYKDCRIEQNDMEAEGLGLRPLSLAENMGKSERNILARRYYRLGQWSEALQGGYWLTVSPIPPFEYDVLLILGSGLGGVQVLLDR
jgi:FKBP12-rapamycin complex-associated protein